MMKKKVFCYNKDVNKSNRLNEATKLNLFPTMNDFSWEQFLVKNLDLKEDLNSMTIASYSSSYYLNGTLYEMPYRIGYQKYDQLEYNNEIEWVVSCCLLTRHHNGFVREKYLKKIFIAEIIEHYPFVIPYIIRLLGEYIEEIWRVIDKNKAILSCENVIRFKNENKLFISKNIERNITYYCGIHYGYYTKRRYCNYHESSGYQILLYIQNL